MTTQSRRAWFSRFLLLGGLCWIAFGLSHLFFPSLLGWDSALAGVPPAKVFGVELSNRGYIYLFNADLLLYDVLLGVMGLLLATRARRGERTAAQWGIGMGVYFVLRGGLQIHYFGTSAADLIQTAACAALAAIHLFPLARLADFAEE